MNKQERKRSSKDDMDIDALTSLFPKWQYQDREGRKEKRKKFKFPQKQSLLKQDINTTLNGIPDPFWIGTNSKCNKQVWFGTKQIPNEISKFVLGQRVKIGTIYLFP